MSGYVAAVRKAKAAQRKFEKQKKQREQEKIKQKKKNLSQKKPLPKKTSSKKTDEPVVIVSAEELMEDYYLNRIESDKKYKGKILQLSGKIVGVGQREFSLYTRQFERHTLLRCRVKSDPILQKIKTMSAVIVQCECMGRDIQDDYIIVTVKVKKLVHGKIDPQRQNKQEVNQQKNGPLPKKAEQEKDSILVVSANKLMRDYCSDRTGADKKYKGKLLQVSGTISNVGIGQFVLDTPRLNRPTMLICMVKNTAIIQKIKKMIAVTVQCECVGRELRNGYETVTVNVRTLVHEKSNSQNQQELNKPKGNIAKKIAVPQKNAFSLQNTERKKDPILKVSVKDLMHDYGLPRSVFDRKYSGKILQLSGNVIDVSNGKFVLYTPQFEGLPRSRCIVKGTYNRRKVKPLSFVIIQCECVGRELLSGCATVTLRLKKIVHVKRES